MCRPLSSFVYTLPVARVSLAVFFVYMLHATLLAARGDTFTADGSPLLLYDHVSAIRTCAFREVGKVLLVL